MRIFAADFSRCTNGWVCRIWFNITTAAQFTDVNHGAAGHSSWWLLAWWRAWRSARRLAAQLEAKPGEREAQGWNG